MIKLMQVLKHLSYSKLKNHTRSKNTSKWKVKTDKRLDGISGKQIGKNKMGFSDE